MVKESVMATNKEKAEDLLKNFTNELIEQIENNKAAWQVPWSPTEHNLLCQSIKTVHFIKAEI